MRKKVKKKILPKKKQNTEKKGESFNQIKDRLFKSIHRKKMDKLQDNFRKISVSKGLKITKLEHMINLQDARIMKDISRNRSRRNFQNYYIKHKIRMAYQKKP